MNRQLSRLALVAVVLLVALVVATTYWQAWAAGGLQDRQDNAVELVAQFQVARGLILADNGQTLLAANRKVRRNGQTFYFRRYPTKGLAAQTVGYSTSARTQSGLEESLNDYLTGANTNLSNAIRRELGAARRRDRPRQQPRADARPGGAGARAPAARRPLRRRRRDEPAHRRDPHDGVDADVRPEPDREDGRLREDPQDQGRLRRRLGAAQQRDRRPLHAGIDVQDGHRRGGARHRRVHADVDLPRPGLLHGVRQEGVERGQPGPEGPGGVRNRDARPGLPALDQLRLLQRRQADRRGDDPRVREEVRLLLDAAARDAGERAGAERPLLQRQARVPEASRDGRRSRAGSRSGRSTWR